MTAIPTPLPPPTPAEQLTGLTLQTGWVVGARQRSAPNATGGTFSTCYFVERDGQAAFLKASDLYGLLAASSPAGLMSAMQQVSSKHLHERTLLEASAHHNMDRVIQTLEASQEQIDAADPFSVVFYFVFEVADGDVRRTHDLTEPLDLGRVFRVLHCVATGIKQLHSASITHQDIKPSNVLQFTESRQEISRIADLGRASTPTSPMDHDRVPCAGDRNYWPPEALYDPGQPDWGKRRACDLFQLGSMLCFLFTGMHATDALLLNVQPAYYPHYLGGPYSGAFKDALPALRASLNDVCDGFPDLADDALRERVVRVFRELCAPSPAERGHPKDRRTNQWSVERYISDFNLLALRTAIRRPLAVRRT